MMAFLDLSEDSSVCCLSICMFNLCYKTAEDVLATSHAHFVVSTLLFTCDKQVLQQTSLQQPLRSRIRVLYFSQVHKATIEGYIGKGSPPHIEMMIIATSDKTTPPDLTVEAKLKGVRTEPNNIIKIEKEAQNVVECVYRVFYHKLEGINHWRARFVFTPKQHKKVT